MMNYICRNQNKYRTHLYKTHKQLQIIEKFMLEEEIESQSVDKCKIVELPDKQEIERETVGLPEIENCL